MSPTFVWKSGLFTNLGEGLSKKVGFLLVFEQIVRFLDKMLALSNKKSTFVLVFDFFGRCSFTILPKYYLKGCFLLKWYLTLP